MKQFKNVPDVTDGLAPVIVFLQEFKPTQFNGKYDYQNDYYRIVFTLEIEAVSGECGALLRILDLKADTSVFEWGFKDYPRWQADLYQVYHAFSMTRNVTMERQFKAKQDARESFQRALASGAIKTMLTG